MSTDTPSMRWTMAEAGRPGTTIPIGGYPVRKTTADTLATELIARSARRESIALFFANTNMIMQCQQLLPALRDDRVIIVNDGIGLAIAARLFHRGHFDENLNGTDFTPYLLARAATPMRVFLLGGKPDVLEKSVRHVEQRLGQRVVGAIDGYQDLDDAALIATIRAAAPDLVLVALGNPLQETWILEHRDTIGAGLFVGVGALFDFWAGDKPRAPQVMRRLRLEWLFRLSLEPKRLLRRYTIDIVRFLWVCYRQRRSASG